MKGNKKTQARSTTTTTKTIIQGKQPTTTTTIRRLNPIYTIREEKSIGAHGRH